MNIFVIIKLINQIILIVAYQDINLETISIKSIQLTNFITIKNHQKYLKVDQKQ